MPELLIPLLIGIFTMSVLIYIAIEDARSLTIPKYLSYGLLAFHLALNLLLVLLYSTETKFVLTNSITYYPYMNLATGATLGTAASLIIFLSKEKGMGWGDAVYLGLLGLICGFPKAVTGLYVAIFAALLYGIIIGIRKGKIRGVKIPFIPFAVQGTVLGLLLGDGVPSGVAKALSAFLSLL